MVRFYAKSCGKSEIRHTLESHFERAFIDGKKRVDSEGIAKPNLIVIDLLQYIKHIKPGVSEYSQASHPGYEGCDNVIDLSYEAAEYGSKFSLEDEVRLRDYSSVVNYLVSVVERMIKASLGDIRGSAVPTESNHLVSMPVYNPTTKEIIGYEYMDENVLFDESFSMEADGKEPVVVVICIDKYRYTCPARRIVHHDRVQKKRDKELAAGAFEEPTPVEPLMYPLDQVTEDKKYNSSVLFRFLARHMIELFKSRKYNRDFIFVFDGHCFDYTTAMVADFWMPNSIDVEDGETKIIDHEGHAIKDLYDTPVVLQKKGHLSKLMWLREFENQIGESDFSPFFYYNHFHLFNGLLGITTNENNNNNNGRKRTLTMDILSNDTDTLVYSLIFLDLRRTGAIKSEEEEDEENEALRRTDYINIHYSKISSSVDSKWVQVRKLMKYISREVGRGKKALSHPALQLAIGSIIAGSDYTEKHKLVPHKHFVNAYIEFYKLIGDIVRVEDGSDGGENQFYKLALRANNYIALIIMSYIQSKIKTKLWNGFVDKLKDAPTYEEIEKILVTNYPHEDKFWLPTHTDIVYSACQIQYYLNMISRLGESSVDIELHDSNLEDYAYEWYSDSMAKQHEETETELDVTIGVLSNRMVRLIHARTPQEIEETAIKILGKKPKPKKQKGKKQQEDAIDETKRMFDEHNEGKTAVKRKKPEPKTSKKPKRQSLQPLFTEEEQRVPTDDDLDFGIVVVGKKQKSLAH